MVSFLLRCCTNIKFKSTDSCTLQFRDAKETLKWPSTKLRNSVRVFDLLNDIKFQSTDSFNLQFIDAKRTLKWPLTKLRISECVFDLINEIKFCPI